MYLIGIAGGSGSGKTTFAKKIMQRVDAEAQPFEKSVALLHQDSYYLPSPPLHLEVHGKPNFDHPDAFDWPLLTEHLRMLKAGESIAAPMYDFRTSRRTAQTERIEAGGVILLEGLFTLWNTEIRDLFDVKIYLNVESDIRFIRRLHRDVRERGRTLDSIIQQYYDTVRPMHHAFIEPTSTSADLVVGEETDIAADVIAARVRQVISLGQDLDSMLGKERAV
jgi:uridine kinase